MSRILLCCVRRAGRDAALTLLGICIVAANSRTFAAESEVTPGRIDFNESNLPAATVEVNLSQGMFGDLVGLGEAAIAGVAETLRQSASAGRESEGTRLAADQLAAAQQIVQLVQGVVREVRVRVYENFPNESVDAASLMSQFDEQLRVGNWENIVKVRDGNDSVRVSLLRKNGAVLGAFVVASDGRSLVLANVVGDVSPENVKKITSAAAKIGLENGLQHVLDLKMQKLRHRLPPPAVSAPTPPTPPAPPAIPNVPQPGQPEASHDSSR